MTIGTPSSGRTSPRASAASADLGRRAAPRTQGHHHGIDLAVERLDARDEVVGQFEERKSSWPPAPGQFLGGSEVQRVVAMALTGHDPTLRRHSSSLLRGRLHHHKWDAATAPAVAAATAVALQGVSKAAAIARTSAGGITTAPIFRNAPKPTESPSRPERRRPQDGGKRARDRQIRPKINADQDRARDVLAGLRGLHGARRHRVRPADC